MDGRNVNTDSITQWPEIIKVLLTGSDIALIVILVLLLILVLNQ